MNIQFDRLSGEELLGQLNAYVNAPSHEDWSYNHKTSKESAYILDVDQLGKSTGTRIGKGRKVVDATIRNTIDFKA
jgi:hypothetical protein